MVASLTCRSYSCSIAPQVDIILRRPLDTFDTPVFPHSNYKTKIKHVADLTPVPDSAYCTLPKSSRVHRPAR